MQAVSESKDASRSNRVVRTEVPNEQTAIEMTGKDRPGLFSEISAALADLHINIIEAHAWSHNARLACVAYISDQTENRIDDNRLATIEDHLTTVLRATTTSTTNGRNTGEDKDQEVTKSAGGLLEGEGSSKTTDVERRLHQLMLSVRDFDRPVNNAWGSTRSKSLPSPRTMKSAPARSSSSSSLECDKEKGKKRTNVSIESCDEKGYSIVMVQSKDRKRLMFDTVCTLTDLQYAIFHASVDSREGRAFQVRSLRYSIILLCK